MPRLIFFVALKCTRRMLFRYSAIVIQIDTIKEASKSRFIAHHQTYMTKSILGLTNILIFFAKVAALWSVSTQMVLVTLGHQRFQILPNSLDKMIFSGHLTCLVTLSSLVAWNCPSNKPYAEHWQFGITDDHFFSHRLA